MNARQIDRVNKQLRAIKPGVNYPSHVLIKEQVKGQTFNLNFNLQSYFVGMYCAIYLNHNTQPQQTGDHDNRKFVAGLKRDIAKALDRGAYVEIGAVFPVKRDAASQ